MFGEKHRIFSVEDPIVRYTLQGKLDKHTHRIKIPIVFRYFKNQ
jgi:hypothetical protein